jgi:hypothetical protein
VSVRLPRLWAFDMGARWRSPGSSGPRASRSTAGVPRTQDEGERRAEPEPDIGRAVEWSWSSSPASDCSS